MNKNKRPAKLTKSELIKTLIISVIAALVFIYSFYESAAAIRHKSTLLIICAAIGLAILFLSIYIGVKIGLKNRGQIMASLQEKEYRPIWIFGISAVLFGAFLNKNPVFQIVWMLAGFGLIRAKRWGLYAFITLAAFYLLLTIADALSGNTLRLLRYILSNTLFGREIAIGAIFFIRALTAAFFISGLHYLTRPKIKEYFK